MYVWKLDDDIGNLLLWLPTLYFWDRISYWTQSSPSAKSPMNLIPTPSARVKDMCDHSIHRYQGSRLSCLCLCCGHFIDWTMFPAPWGFLLMEKRYDSSSQSVLWREVTRNTPRHTPRLSHHWTHLIGCWMFQDTQHLSLGLLDFGALAAIQACHALESWFHFWFAPELYTVDSGFHTCQSWRGFTRVCVTWCLVIMTVVEEGAHKRDVEVLCVIEEWMPTWALCPHLQMCGWGCVTSWLWALQTPLLSNFYLCLTFICVLWGSRVWWSGTDSRTLIAFHLIHWEQGVSVECTPCW